MDGITILNTFINTSSPSWTAGLMVGGVGLTMIGTIAFLASRNFSQFIFGLIVVGIGVIMSICGIICTNKEAIKTTQYECIIDESVTANDLYNKYNVIEKRGEIWVLEEKDNDE